MKRDIIIIEDKAVSVPLEKSPDCSTRVSRQ